MRVDEKDKMSNVWSIISKEAYWMVNKKVAKTLGFNDAAILLADLVSKHMYYQKKNTLIKEKGRLWFFATSSSLLEDTNISPALQRKYISIMRDMGLLDAERMGLPAKMHFSINPENVEKMYT
jgi:hypothetical protein